MSPNIRRSFLMVSVGAGLLLSAPTGAALAQDVSVLAGGCASCHGPDGRSPGAIPSIAGQPFAVLNAQLQAFRTGQPPDATIMTRITKGFTEEQLETLARHFSELPR